MVFSSATFLFVFLPAFFAVYYALPFRYRSAWILAASWIFYGWWRVDFLALLVIGAVTGWLVGARIERLRRVHPARARLWLTCGVCVALGILAYFKYFNFGVDTLSALFGAFGLAGLSAWRVVLPVGISFYTFQVISYMVDVHREDAPVARSFVDVAAYVSLFPQLVAGPIVRYRELADQLVAREHSWERFSSGALRFMVGLARKVLIADAVAPLADAAYAAASPGFVGAWLGVAAYTIQIYFDFAAYSDMAVGLGRMMGFRFPENFDAPYHAVSITEFWRRWHMTLSRWLRDYLYIPLGGNRRGDRRTLVNLMTVMALGGLWHGAAWSFLLWGVWHGALLVTERITGMRRASSPRRAGGTAAFLRRAGTLCAVMIGWVVFRAESIPRAAVLYASMLGLRGLGPDEALAWQIETGAVVALVAGWVIVGAEPGLVRRLADPAGTAVLGAATRTAIYVVFALSLVRVLAASYSPFLYFQF